MSKSQEERIRIYADDPLLTVIGGIVVLGGFSLLALIIVWNTARLLLEVAGVIGR